MEGTTRGLIADDAFSNFLLSPEERPENSISSFTLLTLDALRKKNWLTGINQEGGYRESLLTESLREPYETDDYAWTRPCRSPRLSIVATATPPNNECLW